MEQIQLPTKTKLATQWIRILGILVLISVISLVLFAVIITFLCFGNMNCYFTPELENVVNILSAPLPSLAFMFKNPFPEHFLSLVPLSIVCGALMVFSSHFLKKRKKWSWILSIILFAVFFLFPLILNLRMFILIHLSGTEYTIMRFPLDYFFRIFLYFPPLILLLLDIKNFFKIAS